MRCLAKNCIHWRGMNRCLARATVLSGEGTCREFREAVEPSRSRSGVQASQLPPKVTYRLEMVNCGKCARCRENGPSHGPYWYAYWKEGGVTRSRYLGKGVPAS